MSAIDPYAMYDAKSLLIDVSCEGYPELTSSVREAFGQVIQALEEIADRIAEESEGTAP